MRPGEVEGEDYFFVDQEKFDAMVKGGEFLEHATVFENSYGTPKGPVEAALNEGRDVLFDVDWQGTQQLARNAGKDLVSIFILPPSVEELERRLHRFRAARDEPHPGQSLGRAGDQGVGQLLEDLGGEERGVGVGQAVELVLDRLDHPRMVVAQAGHRGAARGVEIAPTLAVGDVAALAAQRHRVALPRVAVKDVSHGVLVRGAAMKGPRQLHSNRATSASPRPDGARPDGAVRRLAPLSLTGPLCTLLAGASHFSGAPRTWAPATIARQDAT